MPIIFAFGAALFAGVTSVLAKIGIKNVNSYLATALRTIVVLIFAWTMTFVVGSVQMIKEIDPASFVFLVLSGITTGGSWLCYFRALQQGDVNKVVPIDKASTILTMFLAFILLREPIYPVTWISIVLIGLGTYLMIQKNRAHNIQTDQYMWLIYAMLSALLASFTAILSKVGIQNVESNLGTAIRTVVVLIMSWIIVFMMDKQRDLYKIDKKSWIFIGLSGVTTGLSWMCFFKALQIGKASIVVPIDKLSLLVTGVLSYYILGEKMSKKAVLGMMMITFGTLLLAVF